MLLLLMPATNSALGSGGEEGGGVSVVGEEVFAARRSRWPCGDNLASPWT